MKHSGLLDRVYQEIAILKKLDHLNVVNLVEVSQTQCFSFYAIHYQVKYVTINYNCVILVLFIVSLYSLAFMFKMVIFKIYFMLCYYFIKQFFI